MPQSRGKNWCFTLNNYTDSDVDRLSSLDDSDVQYLIAGKEVGENGTPHLQGTVCFNVRRTFNQVIQLLGQCHLTITRKLRDSVEYCKKEGNYFEVGTFKPPSFGKRTDMDDFKTTVNNGCYDLKELRESHSDILARYPRFCMDYINDHSPNIEIPSHPLRPWQEILNNKLRLEPDDRTIIFVVDQQGCSGKSWFSHYYASLHPDTQVLLPGKKADMAYSLQQNLRVVFVDAPRSKQGEFIQYDFLEDLKNGYIFSPKYESRVKRYPKLHIVVNMNEEPDMSKLSIDRYHIIHP